MPAQDGELSKRHEPGKATKKKGDRDNSDERPAKASRKEDKSAAPNKEEQKEEMPPGVKDFSAWQLEPDEFVMKVTLGPKDILGLDVHWDDGRTLYIKGIRAGVVKDWNKNKPDEAVQPGDRVLGINGVADDPQAMLGECKKKGLLNLLVRGQFDRSHLKSKQKGNEGTSAQNSSSQKNSGPEETLLSLDTLGQPLGIDVDWADGRTLYIRSLQPGAIEDWNKAHPADQAVIPGCVLVAVNGISNDVQAMVQQCRQHRRLQLLVRAPPLPPRSANEDRNKNKDRR